MHNHKSKMNQNHCMKELRARMAKHGVYTNIAVQQILVAEHIQELQKRKEEEDTVDTPELFSPTRISVSSMRRKFSQHRQNSQMQRSLNSVPSLGAVSTIPGNDRSFVSAFRRRSAENIHKSAWQERLQERFDTARDHRSNKQANHQGSQSMDLRETIHNLVERPTSTIPCEHQQRPIVQKALSFCGRLPPEHHQQRRRRHSLSVGVSDYALVTVWRPDNKTGEKNDTFQECRHTTRRINKEQSRRSESSPDPRLQTSTSPHERQRKDKRAMVHGLVEGFVGKTRFNENSRRQRGTPSSSLRSTDLAGSSLPRSRHQRRSPYCLGGEHLFGFREGVTADIGDIQSEVNKEVNKEEEREATCDVTENTLRSSSTSDEPKQVNTGDSREPSPPRSDFPRLLLVSYIEDNDDCVQQPETIDHDSLSSSF